MFLPTSHNSWLSFQYLSLPALNYYILNHIHQWEDVPTKPKMSQSFKIEYILQMSSHSCRFWSIFSSAKALFSWQVCPEYLFQLLLLLLALKYKLFHKTACSYARNSFSLSDFAIWLVLISNALLFQRWCCSQLHVWDLLPSRISELHPACI